MAQAPEISPPEVQPASGDEQGPEDQEAMWERLDNFGHALAEARSEAISARQNSGIEDIWQEDEEFYEGIDEMNRGDEKTLWTRKPPGQAPARRQETTRSRVFPNITGPFTDSAAARIADMLLPTDDRAWGLKATTVPDLVKLAKGEYPEGFLPQVAAQNPDQAQMTAALGRARNEAKTIVDDANAKAEKAEKRIEDWHIECQYHAEVRLVIEDSARIGLGVLKGPFPNTKETVAWTEMGLQIQQKLNPASKRIDPWNFYPDGSCGENIHNGAYTWERDYVTRKQIRELMKQEEFIPEQLLKCLKEGPMQASAEYRRETTQPISDPVGNKNRFEIWYFHGTAEREHLEAAGCDCEGVEDPHVPAIVTMINNHVVRASMNPLDTGDFPYDVMVWRRRQNHWAGIGVARQIRTPQKIVTGACRNLMDNAGIAGGPMIIFRQGVVEPADGVATIAPRKVWYIKEDAEEMKDARQAIGTVAVDMLTNDLLAIVQLGLQLAEYVTGMPMLLQGHEGKAPDTLGGMTMLYNNANSVLRRLARTFDDRVTEPHIRRYYVWHLQYGPDEEKGDYSIDARGSSALVERDIQNQELAQIGMLVLDPRFGKDPKKWMDEYLKSRHFDSKRFDYEDDEWRQIVEQLGQEPQDNSMGVAQLKAETEKWKKEYDGRIRQWELAQESQESEKQREADVVLKLLEGEMKSAEQRGERTISIDKIKANIFETVKKLQSQERLAGMKATADLMMKPPVEPPGRAPKGQSVQK